MKKITILLLLLVCYGQLIAKEADNQVGKISLTPYVQDDGLVITETKKYLINKLNQVCSQSGCAGAGFDQRFIITAHLQPLDETVTSSAPAKTVVNLSVTIYVGDGVNGTLFSSWDTTVKGVGDNRDLAWMSAIKKIPTRNSELLAKIEIGKRKIVQYYESTAPSIITKAQATAKGGEYDEAVAMLLAIPAECSHYTKAQNLVSQYIQTAIDNTNLDIISKARAAWAASPDETGASNAESILNSLDSPSAKVRAEAKSLTTEITSRLKAVSDRQFAFEKQQAKWAHQEKINSENNYTTRYVANVKAAARVATAYYKSRPRVVYHVRWW